jgi:hypothetical protein
MVDLTLLANLIKEKNAVDNRIAAIIGRPAQVGHAGECIASAIFDIKLHGSASHQGSDGEFANGPLAGKTVNVKWYLKREGIVDLNLQHFPDYYLVFTGPKTVQLSSRNGTRPWTIESVFLFEAQQLLNVLNASNKKIGIATGVAVKLWDEAEIYPRLKNALLTLSAEQQAQLALFRFEA